MDCFVHISINSFYSIIIFSALALWIALYLIMMKSDQLHSSIIANEHTRYLAYSIANQLRDKIDDTSTIARFYTITGDPKYSTNFNEMVKIAESSTSSKNEDPFNYWYSILNRGQTFLANNNNESLSTLINQSNFNQDETAHLFDAEHHFNNLINANQQAFALINEARAQGWNTPKGKTTALKAREFIQSSEYSTLIDNTIQPINHFVESVNTRVQASLSQLQTLLKIVRLINTLVVYLAICACIYAYLFSKFLIFKPITALTNQAHKISNGNYSIRNDVISDNELGVLGRTINHMCDSIELDIKKNLEIQAKLLEQAIRDPLTGLFNRRYLDETLPRELQLALREKRRLCLAMIDIDHFKHFNDTYGHEAGDEILKLIGKLLMKNFRGSDIACRFGGEEFIVVLIDTDIQHATYRMHDLSNDVKGTTIAFHGHPLPNITISIGLAKAPEDATRCEDLIRAADEALYVAKLAGRDRLEIYQSNDRSND